MLFDAHNHLQDPRFGDALPEIIETMQEAGISKCVVNGTHEGDWPKVARLFEKYPEFVIPSFGLHPWNIDQRSPEWSRHLNQFLNNFPHAGVGECGLDRWIPSPDLEAQHAVFRTHLKLADELNRPLTIHCLRAWGPLMEELRPLTSFPKMLLHSFNGSREIAQQLAKFGAYFSFSGSFLHERKSSLREIFRNLPPDRILLETDAPDMLPPSKFQEFPLKELNHPANLQAIAQGFTDEIGLSSELTAQNGARFFQFF